MHVFRIFEMHAERTKIGFIMFQITNKIPWFFQVDFFKFHDFSRFLGLFSNSMIFPGLEKVFSFSRFPWFFQGLETQLLLVLTGFLILCHFYSKNTVCEIAHHAHSILSLAVWLVVHFIMSQIYFLSFCRPVNEKPQFLKILNRITA